nr:hypothetical protein [Planctomycetota bacterium]
APLAWTGPAREVLPFIDPQAQMQVALDLDTLRTLGAHAKPTSLLGDPAVAVTIAHIRAQFEAARAQMGEVPPMFSLMEQAHGAVLSARATHGDGREGASIAAQLGPAGAAMREYISGHVGQWNLVPRSAGPFSGWVENERRQDIFVGLKGDLLLWATPNQVDESAARAQPRPLLPAAWTRSPSWLRADATLAMDHVRSLQKDGRDVLGVGAWLPRWQTDSPIIDAALSVEDGVWTTSVRISGVSRSGLRPIAASMRRLVPENPYAALAIGCDLADILNRDFAWKKLVPRLTGVSATELAEVLTGDVVAVATPGTPLPGLSVTVAIRPGTDAQQRMATVIARLVSAAHGEPTGPGRWIVSTPAGMLAIGIGPERVAVTTTAEGVDRWLALDAGTGISTEDTTVAIQGDLPALARSYLPVLYALLPAQLPFGLPIEWEIQTRIVPSMLAHTLAQDPTLTASRLLRSDEKPHHLDDVLRSKMPPEELDRALDRALSVFSNGGPSVTPNVTPRSVTLFRLPDGIHEFNWPHVDWTTPLSPQAVAQKIDGLRRILGPDPAELGMFPLPSYDIPRFDRTWLPEIEAVIRHLPRYSFTARTTSDGLAIEERGAPLAGAMSWMAGYLSVIHGLRSVTTRAYHQHLDWLDGPGVKARHAAEVAVFERVKDTIFDYQIRRTLDLPTAPSLLMTGGRLALADFSPFFQGRVPTADELDRLGTWTDGVNSFVESIWSVPLEPGWRLLINGHQSQVVVTSAPNPATEAVAVPKGDQGAGDF